MSQSESKGLRTRSTSVPGQEKTDGPAEAERTNWSFLYLFFVQALSGLDVANPLGEGDLY